MNIAWLGRLPLSAWGSVSSTALDEYKNINLSQIYYKVINACSYCSTVTRE